jgi:hypothetical protein
MSDLAASSGVSSSLLGRHSVLDTACPALDTGESSRAFWIPAFAGMTNSRQAAGNGPQAIQKKENQSAVIRENRCPLFLWLNFLRCECSGKGLEADGMRMEFGFPGGAGEPERIYFLKSFFLPKPANPRRPVPKSSIVAGSGTGE